MPPKQLLRATCLLLLSAAVFGRTILSDEVQASIAAMPMSSLPAEIHPAAVNCVKQAGPNGCLWNTTRCHVEINNCLLCQRNPGDPAFECKFCRPGFFKNGTATCSRCPVGHYCGGNEQVEQCSGGTTTPPLTPGTRVASQQCSSCLPGYGGSSCTLCPAGQFSTRFSTDPCSFCPDGMLANSVVGATDCIAAGASCPTGTTAVNSLRSCGCLPGSRAAPPTNDVFRFPRNADGTTNPWFDVRSNQTFQNLVRMPNSPPSAITSFPVGCTACTGQQASSLNNPTAAGANECRTCPANSRPNVAGEGGVLPLLANAACVCIPGFVPNGPNSNGCIAAGIPCAASPIGGVSLGGCVPPGQETIPPPGTIPTPTPAPSDGDNNKQEWGHWQHKKHHKKQHKHHEEKEESEYYSSDKEYESKEYDSDDKEYMN